MTDQMKRATDYRRQAAACRRAAGLRKRHPSAYLINLAEDYERQAAELEAQFGDDNAHDDM